MIASIVEVVYLTLDYSTQLPSETLKDVQKAAIIGHTFHCLLSRCVSRNDLSRQIRFVFLCVHTVTSRIRAIVALSMLATRVGPGPALASFLPGIASELSR